MELVLLKIKHLMSSANIYFAKADIVTLEEKPATDKWSKKEILGHLIDSAIHNIQRFTEIQDSEKPYQVCGYDPDQLVIANHYQKKDLAELFELWVHLNRHIKFIIRNLPDTALDHALLLPTGESKNLKFLINDYADHLEHHLDQIYRT